MPPDSRPTGKTEPGAALPAGNRLFTRSRNITVLFFIITFCAMSALMAVTFDTAVKKISSEYAESYALSSAEALSARVAGEISVVSKAARSRALGEWLADEYDGPKKTLAYNEMAAIVGELYSFNLYVGVNKSLNEYKVDEVGNIRSFAVLDKNNPTDAWYFKGIESKDEYRLSVDIDRVMQRKRVWLDYKVLRDGAALGIVSTGLEFSHIIGELFSHNDNMRGLIINKDGMIHMDSDLMGDREFLYNKKEIPIDQAFSDPNVLSAIKSYTNDVKGYARDAGKTARIRLSSGSYRYMAIAPVRFTDWVVVVLTDNVSLFGRSLFFPVAAAVLIMMVVFALASDAVNYRLIFRPLGKLDRSLALMKENHDENIYGIGRDDELGQLARTIQDLFNKANVDALTGIYNRRFMETSLERMLGVLARGGGVLSVMMLDVDYFKKYNDTYGHDQGDICLKAVAQSLTGAVKRSGDFTARYGGEEFIIALTETDEAGARLVAEKLLCGVRALAIPHADSSAAPYVTVSIGLTTGKVQHGQSWGDYIKRADEALYTSKQNGRNQYTYSPMP